MVIIPSQVTCLDLRQKLQNLQCRSLCTDQISPSFSADPTKRHVSLPPTTILKTHIERSEQSRQLLQRMYNTYRTLSAIFERRDSGKGTRRLKNFVALAFLRVIYYILIYNILPRTLFFKMLLLLNRVIGKLRIFAQM